jgi:hypothetical protein
MRSLTLPLVAVATLLAEIAQGEQLPTRKPGLWELSWYSDHVGPSQSRTAKMCIDAATDEKLAAIYDPCDPPFILMFYAPQFTKVVVCEAFIDTDLKMVSRSQITFTGYTAYQ